MSVKSLRWEYDDDAEKLHLIEDAVKKAKHKAEQMMEVIGYTVVGIRSCSDSYKMPSNRRADCQPTDAGRKIS